MHLGEAHWPSLLFGEQQINSKQNKILVHPLSDAIYVPPVEHKVPGLNLDQGCFSQAL